MIDEIESPVPMTFADAPSEVIDESNAAHLREWEGDAWYPVLIEVDRQLSALDPAYRIAQVKEKFGGLRYYYDTEYEFDSPVGRQMYDVVGRAEQAIAELERRRRLTPARG